VTSISGEKEMLLSGRELAPLFERKLDSLMSLEEAIVDLNK